MSEDKIGVGPATLFNTHMTDWGTRVNTFINYLLLVSGGILSITIGAFLSANPPKLGAIGLLAIRNGWYLLSASLVFALLLIFLLIVAQAIVIAKWKRIFTEGSPRVELLQGAMWFRVVIWVVIVSAFLCCVGGISFLSVGACQLLRVQP